MLIRLRLTLLLLICSPLPSALSQDFTGQVIGVIAIGWMEFLTRLVQQEGQYYFDDPNFHPPGSL